MTPDDAPDEIEAAADLFLGHAISRVRYLGWWRDVPEEPGAYVEYVEVTMDDVLDASERGGWKPLLGRSVAGASIGWAEVDVAKVQLPERSSSSAGPAVSVRTERVAVPDELELRFEGGASVILTAAAWRRDGTLATDVENVAVVFGDLDAQRFGVGRWRSGRIARPPPDRPPGDVGPDVTGC